MLNLVSKIVNEKLAFCINYEIVDNMRILNQNTDKQSQNTHVEVHIFVRQKSNARSRVWIV